MPAAIQRLSDQPVIVVTITDPFDAYQELPATEQRFRELADTIQGPVYRIIDMREWHAKFIDVMSGLAFDTRREGGMSKDSRIRTVLIGSGEMIKITATAMTQKQYGGNEQPLVGSMEEALDCVHADQRK
jgi:hypothetical protein